MPSFSQVLQQAASTMAVSSAFFFEGAAYNLVFIGRILPAVGKQDLMLPFALLFNTVLLLAVWSYVQARTGDPGAVLQRWQAFVGAAGDSLQVAPARLEWQPGKATYCNQCGVPRPERAHHCRKCGICILRMDHHCPWLNNCVGFKNHKHFILTVGYSLVSCVVGIFTALPELAACFEALVREEEGLPLGRRWNVPMSDAYVLLTFGSVALLFSLALSTMLAAHVELCAHNATSIEGHYDNMPNPFDQGTAMGNMAQLFGEPGLDWLLPIAPRRPATDGVSYERTDERIVGPDSAPSSWVRGLGAEEIWRIRYRVRLPQAPKDIELGRGGRKTWWGSDLDPLMCVNRESTDRYETRGRGSYVISL